MRLTIHLENALFFEKAQKNVGTKENPVMKPKKSKCIQNTLSYKNVTSKAEAQSLIASARKKYGIAKWEKGLKKNQEMIYIVH
jgi:hypothetical protein